MSLILDALKQAESERGRGALPGVFSQPPHAPEAPARAPVTRHPVVWLLAAFAGAALLGYLAWNQVPGVARPAAAPTAMKPVPTMLPAATATVTAAAPSSAAASRPAGALFNPPAPPAKAAVTAAAPSSAAPRPEPAPQVPTATPAAPALSSLPPYALPAPPAATVPTVAELPADIRAQLPGVNITGHTFSDNPTLRMLMIDGRMFVEGQAVSPGLRVERIGSHQAVFNHRGTRFSVDYP
jgi:general secretion pathway protein B